MNLLLGDCLVRLRELAGESIDSLVTDPPAGIGFMGKDWDGDRGGRDAWVAWMTDVMRECLRVLKPGAHGLVWALPRTAHWTATALENAGFEVRDCVTHLFGTGFPKSLNVGLAIDKMQGEPNRGKATLNIRGKMTEREDRDYSHKGVPYEPATDAAKQWQGWGTALKPACEFWWLVRKPLAEKTVAANVLRWGTGGLNIDGSRIDSPILDSERRTSVPAPGIWGGGGVHPQKEGEQRHNPQGRFPANLVLDEEAAAALDEQSGTLVSKWGKQSSIDVKSEFFNKNKAEQIKDTNRFTGDSGGASRFFYVAKASKKDRGEGNTHPTVKSTALMAYLVKLVTPPGGIVLDPFMGSGSTGVAAKREGRAFLGIEQSETYLHTARERIAT